MLLRYGFAVLLLVQLNLDSQGLLSTLLKVHLSQIQYVGLRLSRYLSADPELMQQLRLFFI